MFAAFWIVISSFLPQFIRVPPSWQWPGKDVPLMCGRWAVRAVPGLYALNLPLLCLEKHPGVVLCWKWGVGMWKPWGFCRITPNLPGVAVVPSQGVFPGQEFCVSGGAGAMLCSPL